LLYSDCFDLVLITESWCDDTFTHGLLDPELKYNIYRRDHNRHGGGVCIFVANFLKSTQVDMNDEYSHLEIVCVDIFTSPTALRVFTAYRPPKLDNTAAVYQASLMQCIRAHALFAGPCKHCN